MPEVVGRTLDLALSDVERAGIDDEVEVVGGGLFGVVDEANWEVCEQLPVAGTAVREPPRLTVERSCGGEEPSDGVREADVESAEDNFTTEEAAPTEDGATSPTSETASEPAAPTAEDPEPLTVTTNEDFGRVMSLTDTCSPQLSDFAERYAGQEIAFDGSIVAMNNHEDYDTRYDILIKAGAFSETVSNPGPDFQFRDVNVTTDLQYTSDDVPDTIGVGTEFGVVAEIVEYKADSCLLLLEPVATSFD